MHEERGAVRWKGLIPTDGPHCGAIKPRPIKKFPSAHVYLDKDCPEGRTGFICNTQTDQHNLDDR